MKTKILGLLAVGLLAGPMAANATLLNFELTDGTSNISFQLDSNPTPSDSGATYTVFFDVAVAVNGAPSVWNLSFYPSSAAGGLELSLPGGSTSLISQVGDQIYSGTTSIPIFAPGQFSLKDYVAADSTYDRNFNLVISAASVPEPGTLALLGLGLAGIGLGRRRKAH